MTVPRRWLACLGVIFSLASALGTSAQEGTVGAERDSGAPSEELDAAALAEVERLRSDLDRLLSTVPPSLHDRVRELLLTPPTPSAPSKAASSQESIAVEASTAEEADTPTDPILNAATPGASGKADAEEVETAVAAPIAEEGSAIDAPATQAAALEPSKRKGPNPRTRRQTRQAVCNSLDPLDENGDGKINSQDRYWRYLYVWIDQNRDGQRQEKEVESTYAAGVREIETGLSAFYRKKGSLGEIRRRDTLLLDLAGNGFGTGRRPDDGVLMVDADGLGRGDGPKVFDADGVAVTGVAPFIAGWQMRLADGEVLTLNCPQSGSN